MAELKGQKRVARTAVWWEGPWADMTAAKMATLTVAQTAASMEHWWADSLDG